MRHSLERVPKAPLIVTPAQAGVQEFEKIWIPANPHDPWGHNKA